jgi:hypothetical protein
MDSEFVNAYIEKLLNELVELTKTRLLLETQLTMASKAMANLKAENDKLQASLNKKASKNKEESNTF